MIRTKPFAAFLVSSVAMLAFAGCTRHTTVIERQPIVVHAPDHHDDHHPLLPPPDHHDDDHR